MTLPRIITRPTITETFLERVRLSGDGTGFMYKAFNRWREVSYREFFDECRSLSFGLMALGLEAGDRVALLSNTRFEWSLADMAILGARGVTVPIYPSSTADDVAYILGHSEARIVIVEDENQLRKVLAAQSKRGPGNGLPHLRHVIALDLIPPELAHGAGRDALTPALVRDRGRLLEARDPTRFERQLGEAKPSDLITITYTSGTSGTPKGVELTHDNLMSVMEDCAEILRGRADLREITVLSFLPFSHIFGKVESMLGHVIGWRQAFVENADKLMSNLSEIRPNLMFAVPRVFEKAYARIESSTASAAGFDRRAFDWAMAVGRRYWEARWQGRAPSVLDTAQRALADRTVYSRIRERFGGRLQYVVCGGAPLPREIGEFFQIVGIPILEGYGLTETCAPVTLNPPEAPRYGTVGLPLREVSIKTADDGEILVRSRKVFAGYYKMPDETARAVVDGWFRTGDIGRIDADGYLTITDRKKDLIITSGGKNVAPQKIENEARSSRYLSQLVVVGDRRPYLTALVTLDREQIIRFASENRILFSEYGELIKNHKIISLVGEIVADINSRLAGFEGIKKFVILPQEFTIEGGELTTSLKIRRRVVYQRYRAEIESMYDA